MLFNNDGKIKTASDEESLCHACKPLSLLFPLSGLLSHTPQGWLLLITWASAEMSSSKKSFLMTYLGYLLKPDTPLHHRVYFLLFGL